MKKILVLGATGMAGHVIYLYLKSLAKYEMYNIVFRTKLTDDSLVVDVTDKERVQEAIERVNPDIIINCIGVLIKGSKEHPDNAIYINAYLPHLLKRISDKLGSKLIHISTDCVFSGKKGQYTENDTKDADDTYGRSKSLGEINNDKDLTLRTSIIGPEIKMNGEGLFHWFMNQKGNINGYNTAIWGGVTTIELAKAIDAAIDANLTGLAQLSNGIGISKFDLLNLFKNIWSRNDIEILSYDGNDIDKSIAKSSRFEYEVPSYNKMLEEMHHWMDLNIELYRGIYL